jgi:hypothetical protein
MFIGHYGIALAAKRVDKNIPLGLLFFCYAVCRYIVLFVCAVRNRENVLCSRDYEG